MNLPERKDWPLKKITANQVVGSQGEAFVSFLLSKYCLVRPVANGTDVGVDLYCEVLQGGIPHNHFWVQVKAQSKRTKRRRSLKISDLEYWSRQPIPVFIFFISLDDLVSFDTFKIDVVDLTDQFIKEDYIDPKGRKGRNLNQDFVLNSLMAVERFVFDTVPISDSRIQLRDGFIFPVKRTVHSSYILDYQARGVRKYSKQFIKNIGRTSAILLLDICKSDEFEKFPSERNRLEQVLECFKDFPNYDFHYALGYSKMISDRDHQSALDSFRKGLILIESDTKIPPSQTEQIRSLISMYIRKMEKKLKQR